MHPDFTGTWRADLERSRLIGPKPQALTVTIEHRDPELTQTVETTTPTASERVVFLFRTDGADSTNEARGTKVLTRALWQGDELCIESTMQSGGRQFHFRDFWSISADGNTLKMEHRDDDLAGQVSILERIR